MSIVENKMKKIKIYVVLILVLALVASGAVYLYHKSKNNLKSSSVTSFDTPIRTDYGNVLPPGFPKTFPIADKMEITKSYTKIYSSTNQMSVLFGSRATVEENIAYYQNIAKSKNWKITAVSTGKKASSLDLYVGEYRYNMVFIVTSNTKNASATTSPYQKEYTSYVIVNVFK